MDFLQLNGGRLAYEYIRSNEDHPETVVLLHGLGMNMTYWKPLLPYWSDCSILQYDLRGHGKTTLPADPTSFDTLVSDFSKLLHTLDIRECHLVTHGLGTFIGLEVMKQPKSVQIQSITILSTPCFYPIETLETGCEYRKKQWTGLDSTAIGEYMAKELLFKRTEKETNWVINCYEAFDKSMYFPYVSLILASLNDEALEQLEIPVLLLAGEKDPNYPPKIISISAAHLKDCRFLVVPKASNLVHLDQPEITASWIQEFIWDTRISQKDNSFEKEYVETLHKHLRDMASSLRLSYKKANHLEVRMVQTFEVRYNGKKIEGKWNQRKAKQLISLLALEGSATREQLLDILWPHAPLHKSKGNLRVCLHYIKQLFEQNGVPLQEILSATSSVLTWKIPISTDYQTIKGQLKKAQKEKRMDIKETLSDDLFDMLPHQPFPELWEDYFLDLRLQLENEAAELQKELISWKVQENRDDWFKHCRHLIRLEHLDFSSYREMMDSLEARKRHSSKYDWKEVLKELRG